MSGRIQILSLQIFHRKQPQRIQRLLDASGKYLKQREMEAGVTKGDVPWSASVLKYIHKSLWTSSSACPLLTVNQNSLSSGTVPGEKTGGAGMSHTHGTAPPQGAEGRVVLTSGGEKLGNGEGSSKGKRECQCVTNAPQCAVVTVTAVSDLDRAECGKAKQKLP